MDRLVGQSEKKIAQALRIVKACAPCVLLMDEVEKMLGGKIFFVTFNNMNHAAIHPQLRRNKKGQFCRLDSESQIEDRDYEWGNSKKAKSKKVS